jgi:hypothetical protein
VTLLAHCGAYWYYCDPGSVVAGIFFLWLVRRSVKRAERKAKERAAARHAARAIAEIAARQQQTKGESSDQPLL